MKGYPDRLYFGPKNFTFMLLGVALIVIGFTLMAIDSEPYGFGTTGLTFGTLFCLAGFVIEFYAIMAKAPSKEVK